MIEIICNDNDENTSKESAGVTSIRRPKNIKQIGDVSSDKKIYIEDYAFTYINSLAYTSPSEEQSGVLLGKFQKSQDEKCIFIKGVIKAKPDENNQHTGICFNENVWKKIYCEVEKYFPELQIVGWFAAVESITPELMEYLKKVHVDNFSGNMKTMYLVNTSEKEESFYLYENSMLKKQKGYVCFYERNFQMQEYMMEKRGHRPIETVKKDKVVDSIRTIMKEKEEIRQQKRTAAIMYGISTFMAVAVLVVGINLMNSYEKMKSFDKSLNNMAKEISDISNEGAKDTVVVNKIDGNVKPTQEETSAFAQDVTKNDGGQQTTINQDVTHQNAEQEGYTKQDSTDQSSEISSNTSQMGGSDIIKYESYTVKKGDTIIGICEEYYGNHDKLGEVLAFNNIEDANVLYVGQEIKLP